MNRTEFAQRLEQIEPNSMGISTLGEELLNDARYPSRLAVSSYLLDANQAIGLKGMLVLDCLGELSLMALAESPPMDNPVKEIWVLRHMCDELIASRKRVASVLTKLLLNMEPLPPAPPGRHTFPPGVRVCDLAFVLINKMMRTEHLSDSFFVNSYEERNGQIELLNHSKSLKILLEI